jgi:RNA polymerase sigma-70 factor, ECF subfamily
MATTSSKMSSSTRSTHDLQAGPIDNPGSWLFRIVHNAALDFLRRCARIKSTRLDDEAEIGTACQAETADVVAASFRRFLQLPVLQRCAVIPKDILRHSVDEIAATAPTGLPACPRLAAKGRWWHSMAKSTPRAK